MPTATTNDGVELYYELKGNESADKNVVFVMGLCASHRAWHLQVAFFTKQNYRVLVFDNRGSGFSQSPPPPYTMSRMAEDVVFLTRVVGFSTFHLVGMSMGGMIAQHVALSVPETIVSLILVVTRLEGGFKKNLPTGTGMLKFFKMSVYAGKDISKVLKAAVDLMFPSCFLNLVAEGETVTNRKLMFDQIKSFNEGMPFPTDNCKQGQYAAIRAHGLIPEQIEILKKAKFPILAITGDKDILVKPRHTYKMPDLIGADVVILEGAGHGLLNQAPTLANDVMHKYFELASVPNFSRKTTPEVIRLNSLNSPVQLNFSDEGATQS